ncbi:hypothetical protein BLOT_005481 [Blomia tropicalis]|nr:hypothetical protein BLOT_005481 [Blomia tropicalis]
MSPFTAKPLLFSWVKSKSYDPKNKSPVYSSESTDTDPLITSLKQPRRFLALTGFFTQLVAYCSARTIVDFIKNHELFSQYFICVLKIIFGV